MSANPTKGFTPTTDLLNASPNVMFTFFLFNRWDKYLDAMMTPEKIDIDAATASLLSTCTDTAKRDEFYDKYLKKKEELGSAITASILISGEFFSYVAEVCEFVERSYGGIA